jgi:hypothetical protein
MVALRSTPRMPRIQPSLKQGLRERAAREHRSLSNLIEVLILDHGRRRGPVLSAAHPDADFTHPTG